MDLSDVLADESAHVQAKEAEALAILTALAGPAKRMIDYAEREFGSLVPRGDLGMFVSPTAHEMFNAGRRNATRLLFDAYAATVFRLVPEAETFIEFLGPIGERVKLRLSVIDQHEAELCRLEWVKQAWERARPTPIRRAWRKLRALGRQTVSQIEGQRVPADSLILRKPGDTPATVTPVAEGRVTTNSGDGISDAADGMLVGKPGNASQEALHREAQPTVTNAELGRRPDVQHRGGPQAWNRKLRAARDIADLTRPEAAKALKKNGVQITADAIKKHEEGIAMPRPDVRKAYASIYKTSEEELFPHES